MTSTRAGDLDWVRVWREMRAADEAAVKSVAGARPAQKDPWIDRAKSFDEATALREPDAVVTFLRSIVRREDAVLDVGAGVGRYVPWLARMATRVIAVEPSPSMRARLEGRVRDEGLTNVEVLDARWPIDPPPRADVVLCAHVLYAVDDVEPFLRALDAAARREVVLVSGMRPPFGVLDPIWSEIHGRTRPPRPGALEALAVAHQLGFAASFTVIDRRERTFSFHDEADAVQTIRARFGLEPSTEMDARIVTAIRARMRTEPDGRLHVEAPAHDVIVRWSH